MEERISIREWQKRYKAGEYNSKARSVQCEAGWYDWFCKDEGLLGRLQRLAPLILGITVPEVLDNYYLWLKNNCPVKGPLYDDVRFEPLEGERDGRYFIVQHESPWEIHRWTIYTERRGFDEPEFGCQNVREMCKYINEVGGSIWARGVKTDEASNHSV